MVEEAAAPIVTLEEFQATDPEAPIRDLNYVDCLELASAYEASLKVAGCASDATACRVYMLLHDLCWFSFKPSDRAEPFGPMLVIDGKRSPIPSDYRGEQNEVLAALASGINSPALRARLADVAWLNDRRKADCGRLAVRSYIECIERLLQGEAKLRFGDDKPWDHAALEMLRRALIIANAMGPSKSEADLAKGTVEKIREAARAQSSIRGCYRTAKLALDFGIGDAGAIGLELEAAAELTLDSGNFSLASKLYDETERAFSIARDATGVERCVARAADCYVAWADASSDSAMSESHWLQQAIAKLRNIKNTRERREGLQARLVTVQPRIRDEMNVFETEINLTDLVDHATTVVAGCSLIRAFAEFVRLERSRDPDTLRADASKSAASAPLFAILSASVHDSEGKMIAKSPGIGLSSTPDEAAIHHLILQNESQRWHRAAQGLIEPARRVIYAEHPIEERDILPLMEISPLVPPDREMIFARAFARFFGGDFMSAIHLLFPQLENSLRFSLKEAGFDPTSIKSDMTQQDITMSVMLEAARPNIEAIFGPAIVLELDNLFNVPGGPAIRHTTAHGLQGENAFWSGDVIYACWFVFRLCLLPLLRDWERVEAWYAEMVQ